MTYDETLSYLESLGHETLTLKLGLTNTELLLSALGSPHREYPSVQIVGTNGKGSLAMTIESVCRAAGIRCGLFISPHLVTITERIRITGKQISDSDFARLTTRVKKTAGSLLRQGKLQTLPTVFEQVTAIALLAFREAHVELAFLEAGLGGRLDATTAAGAKVVGITSITLDHEEYLGHTIADIAAEKSAIIQAAETAVIAPQLEEALTVLRKQCEASRVEARFVGLSGQAGSAYPNDSQPGTATEVAEIVDASDDGRLCVKFETAEDKYGSIWPGLRGRHQIANLATAIALAEVLRARGFAIPREAIIRGIETTSHPGRLEVWGDRDQILFDGAHNPAAARALRCYIDEFVKQPVTLIFGAMRDKALKEMVAMLFPAATAAILTELDDPRAASHAMLKDCVPVDFDQDRLWYASSVEGALRTASEINSPGGLVCVTGSLYLVGAAQQILRRKTDLNLARHNA